MNDPTAKILKMKRLFLAGVLNAYPVACRLHRDAPPLSEVDIVVWHTSEGYKQNSQRNLEHEKFLSTLLDQALSHPHCKKRVKNLQRQIQEVLGYPVWLSLTVRTPNKPSDLTVNDRQFLRKMRISWDEISTV